MKTNISNRAVGACPYRQEAWGASDQAAVALTQYLGSNVEEPVHHWGSW
ncbi:MAG TPA: hypothetical protein PLD74_10000 [Prolixibacteraceae bacterium]|nr:hypothetical protein [Prolixibacteraceae bacterium]HOS00835.1 hypothetical protein [Prolixibacteraceae bacterium]HOS90814.1 hypothetical protein [Prolixibacteraceae bacterium]HPL45906.1 hypothetical protein [Prolixibacteraceae bacterium]HQE52684.1 hypothetical protein [Prolixibacteraceae bacterium]